MNTYLFHNVVLKIHLNMYKKTMFHLRYKVHYFDMDLESKDPYLWLQIIDEGKTIFSYWITHEFHSNSLRNQEDIDT